MTDRGARRLKRPLAQMLAGARLPLMLVISGLTVGSVGPSTGAAWAVEPLGTNQPSGTAPSPSPPGAPPTKTEGVCGKATGQTAAHALGQVAERIYANESYSDGVAPDRAQIENYGPLQGALARGDRGAVTEAVTYLVYSHTHIVRLRVSRGQDVLADVGGPYILAPQHGYLRYHGRIVGRYIFSVQDDAGYAKLENRFVEVPILVRRAGIRLPVEVTMNPGSQRIPANGPVHYHGARYQTFSFTGRAFLGEPLQITLLVPLPRSTLTCRAIRLLELRRVGEITWRKFKAFSSPWASYTGFVSALTGSLVYVREGSHQLAGSTNPGPPLLPHQGTVEYSRRTYSVTSFPVHFAGQPIRVYQLART